MSDLPVDITGPTPRNSVIIVGGGISGLTLAYWLVRSGAAVTVLESGPVPGGTMRTIRRDGWLIETGPNSALETTPLFADLFAVLGIAGELRYAGPGAEHRYILRDGTLHALPLGPGAFLRSRLWSWPGKLRLLQEPFIGRARDEESVAAFVERRLGREFLDYAINPFVAGVFAGDPASLSVREAFPKLYALEAKYGSILKGALLSARERKKRAEKAKNSAKMFSFRDGMETFPAALGRALGSALRTGCTVEHVIPMRAGKRPVYTVTYERNGVREQREANVVVLATPTRAAARIVRPIDPAMAGVLEGVVYPPVAEVFVGYPAGRVGRALDGFGFLVPAKEERRLLGCIWSSSLFEGRAPAGHVALTAFVGGSRQPALAALPEAEIAAIVQGELRELLGAQGEPSFLHVVRWEHAIPQYTLGYRAITGAMERFEANFPGAFFCSNARGGISVGDCVMSARTMADRVAAYLADGR